MLFGECVNTDGQEKCRAERSLKQSAVSGEVGPPPSLGKRTKSVKQQVVRRYFKSVH